MADLYEILGVTRFATFAEIRRAYRQLALEHHPDRAPGSATRFREIKSAYEVLSDPERRRRYDQWLQDDRMAQRARATSQDEATPPQPENTPNRATGASANASETGVPPRPSVVPTLSLFGFVRRWAPWACEWALKAGFFTVVGIPAAVLVVFFLLLGCGAALIVIAAACGTGIFALLLVPLAIAFAPAVFAFVAAPAAIAESLIDSWNNWEIARPAPCRLSRFGWWLAVAIPFVVVGAGIAAAVVFDKPSVRATSSLTADARNASESGSAPGDPSMPSTPMSGRDRTRGYARNLRDALRRFDAADMAATTSGEQALALRTTAADLDSLVAPAAAVKAHMRLVNALLGAAACVDGGDITCMHANFDSIEEVIRRLGNLGYLGTPTLADPHDDSESEDVDVAEPSVGSTGRLDAENFTVSYPREWRVEALETDEGGYLDTTIVDPSHARTYLRVDVTPGYDRSCMVTNARTMRSSISKLDGYEEIAYDENVTFQGDTNAIWWEWLVIEKGVRVHKIDVFFIRDGAAFGVLTQAPVARWDALAGLFANIRDGVNPHPRSAPNGEEPEHSELESNCETEPSACETEGRGPPDRSGRPACAENRVSRCPPAVHRRRGWRGCRGVGLLRPVQRHGVCVCDVRPPRRRNGRPARNLLPPGRRLLARPGNERRRDMPVPGAYRGDPRVEARSPWRHLLRAPSGLA